MRDNKTSQSAQEYDANIQKTIPLYAVIHEQVLDLVKTLRAKPQDWLDAGCGTGILVEKAAGRFDKTNFILSDPSDAMLEIAKNKLPQEARFSFVLGATEDLCRPSGSVDVITAILSHHYVETEIKRKITENCYNMLKPGGVYINVESIRPLSEQGLQTGLERWRQAQLNAGKSPDAVVKHISRYGIEFLPSPASFHIELLHGAGFASAELFWASYLQAGFYAVK